MRYFVAEVVLADGVDGTLVGRVNINASEALLVGNQESTIIN